LSLPSSTFLPLSEAREASTKPHEPARHFMEFVSFRGVNPASWLAQPVSDSYKSRNMEGFVLRIMYIMVDVEADGPIPGKYSMIELGAVAVEPGLGRSFYGRLRPISEDHDPEALAITGHTRKATLDFDEPLKVMTAFEQWINRVSPRRPVFISDNNGFDWMFVCWYFHTLLGRNPFGHSSQNLNSLYKGLTRDLFASFKHLRRTPHDHNPVNDARGNAEALLTMIDEYHLNYERD